MPGNKWISGQLVWAWTTLLLVALTWVTRSLKQHNKNIMITMNADCRYIQQIRRYDASKRIEAFTFAFRPVLLNVLKQPTKMIRQERKTATGILENKSCLVKQIGCKNMPNIDLITIQREKKARLNKFWNGMVAGYRSLFT